MASIKRSTPRQISFTSAINPYAHGSTMAEFGQTKVHITASCEESVPPFLRGLGKGWITAEYSMLPLATHSRSLRERGKIGGRTQEIQRLIGRSLRAMVDQKKLGERSILVDCDVLVADGGTRTASISGACVAVNLAVRRLMEEGVLKENPITAQVAALSFGIDSQGDILADLNYREDSRCETDLNLVLTKDFHIVEVQGTAEGRPFSFEALNSIVECSQTAIREVFRAQDQILSPLWTSS